MGVSILKHIHCFNRKGTMTRTMQTATGLVLVLLMLFALTPSGALSQSLPAHWDWNAEGKVTPAKSVESCGSIAAFATVAAVESKILILADVKTDLSEQQLLSCDGGVTCEGGFPVYALEYIRDMGLVEETVFPYQGTDGVACPTPLPQVRAKIEGFYNVDMTGDRAAQIANIKKAIYKDGPVVAYFRLPDDFASYTGGIYKNTSGTSGIGSNLLLVGWDDVENYWIAKNSWGTSWGDEGFILIDRDTDIGLYTYPPMAVLRTDYNGDGVWDGNQAPVANAGADQTVRPGSLVVLDGTESYDTEGDYPLTYSWVITSKPPGSSGSLSDPTGVNPSFIADLTGDYTVTLVVTDSLGYKSSGDEVHINTTNSPPVADAGPDQSIHKLNVQVQLDGSQSYDLESDRITYEWTITEKPSGSEAELSDSWSVNPTFFADIYGTYKISLLVSDPWALSVPDEVVVSFENVKPVANAGDNQSVIIGPIVIVNLDGVGSSDANGDELSFNWSIVTKPEGSLTEIVNPTESQAILTPDLPGTYVVSLVVNDGFIDSDPSNLTITAITRKDVTTQQLSDILGVINDLDPSDFKNANMKNALTNKINAVLIMIDEGQFRNALDKLEHDILAKTDGCDTGGQPDKNDWITNCSDQEQIYPMIKVAIEFLQTLITNL